MGVDVGAWLGQGGRSLSWLDDPATAVDYPVFRQLVLGSLAMAGEPAMGLLVGERLLASTHGILGYAAMSSWTIRQATSCSSASRGSRTPFLQVSHEVQRGRAVRVGESLPLGDIQRPVLEAVVLSVKNVLDSISMGACRVLRVSFPFEAPDYEALAREMFGCELAYGQRWGGLTLPADMLDVPLRMADPQAFHEAAAICERELDKLRANESLAARVRRLLLEKQNGFPSLQVTARLCRLTPRSRSRWSSTMGPCGWRCETRASASPRRSFPTSSSASIRCAGRRGATSRGRASASRWCRSSPASTAARSRWRASRGGGRASPCASLGAPTTCPGSTSRSRPTPSTAASTRAGSEPFVAEALQWLPGETAPEPAVEAAVGGLPRKRIVLADDNADMRDYVRRLLAREHEVVVVGDGRQALEEVRARRPDMLLSDVMMPEMDGIELLGAVRADPSLSTLPVLLLSARAGEEARLGGLEVGADDYVTKPFSAKELTARVRSQLHLADLRQQAREATEASERLYRQLIEGAQDGIVVVDREGVATLANTAAQRMFGYDERSLVGLSVTDLLAPELRDQHRRDLAEYARSGGGALAGHFVELRGLSAQRRGVSHGRRGVGGRSAGGAGDHVRRARHVRASAAAVARDAVRAARVAGAAERRDGARDQQPHRVHRQQPGRAGPGHPRDALGAGGVPPGRRHAGRGPPRR